MVIVLPPFAEICTGTNNVPQQNKPGQFRLREGSLVLGAIKPPIVRGENNK
jgi:hypothetical protein